jgi:hypothetical protein
MDPVCMWCSETSVELFCTQRALYSRGQPSYRVFLYNILRERLLTQNCLSLRVLGSVFGMVNGWRSTEGILSCYPQCSDGSAITSAAVHLFLQSAQWCTAILQTMRLEHSRTRMELLSMSEGHFVRQANGPSHDRCLKMRKYEVPSINKDTNFTRGKTCVVVSSTCLRIRSEGNATCHVL